MKYITSFLIPLVLFAASLNAAPTTDDDDKVEITRELYTKEFTIYTADHEIVNLLVPLNKINLDEDSNEDTKDSPVLFFALADINDKGEKTDRGFYKLENNVAQKLLDNGRDSTAEGGESELVYIAADDGIYVFDYAKNNTKKYGTINENLVKLVKVNNTDLFYMLSADNKVYKVTNEGTKKDEIKDLSGTTDIALGLDSILYYIKDSKLFAYDNGVTEITVPEGEKKLIRPPFILEEGILCLVGKELYTGYKNGTSENADFVVFAKPSAYAADFALIQYYAFERKIYEVNVLGLFLTTLSEELSKVITEYKDELEVLSNSLTPIKVAA